MRLSTVIANMYGIINQFSLEIILGLIICIFLLLILNLQTRSKVKRIRESYDILVGGNPQVNIDDVLMDNQRNISEINEEIGEIQKKISSMEVKHSFALQKVGFIRYNAFDGVGNELSYSIALLDSYNTGFVLSSIFGRESSVNYSKPIKNGESKIPLSAEEQIAMDRALKGENIEKVF